MNLSLIIGRFQPFHKGHAALVTKALEIAPKVLLLVGSSNILPDSRNPFTAEQRLSMITSALKEEGIPLDSVIIRALPDQDDDIQWITSVIGLVQAFEEDPTEVTLLCNPKDTKWYRNNLLYPIEEVNTVDISATMIREAWYYRTSWTVQEYLHDSTITFMTEHEDYDRLQREYITVRNEYIAAKAGHPYRNPIYPVTFGVIYHEGKVLVAKRLGDRGHGQYGLPGGYIDAKETTFDSCIREIKEELNVDIKPLLLEGRALCYAHATDEQMDDIGTRTIGYHLLFILKDPIEVNPDREETGDYQWVPVEDLFSGKFQLFYNHNRIVRHLFAKVGGSYNV